MANLSRVDLIEVDNEASVLCHYRSSHVIDIDTRRDEEAAPTYITHGCPLMYVLANYFVEHLLK